MALFAKAAATRLVAGKLLFELHDTSARRVGEKPAGVFGIGLDTTRRSHARNIRSQGSLLQAQLDLGMLCASWENAIQGTFDVIGFFIPTRLT